MLKASGITKSFGDLKVLKGINLDVKKSEIISIVGSSGAGKSTLLHILGTLDNPDSGVLTIDDKHVDRMRPREKAAFRNKHLGFIFQFHNLLAEFTALENICIPGYIGGMSRSEVEGRAMKLMRRLGIEARHDHKPSELSGGEQQRVAVARALINDPVVVFADEPSGNLDSKNAEELHRLFFELRDEFSQTFVVVTHNEELAHMADRMLEMKDGLILGSVAAS